MNLRIALVLVVALAGAAIVVTLVVTRAPSASGEPDLPFFYTIDSDDLRVIKIDTPDASATFSLETEERIWYFEDPEGIPVNHDRFGGMAFLLGGPKEARALQDAIDDAAQFGLDEPSIIVTLKMRTGDEILIELGDKTRDEESHYARLTGYPELVLIDSSWGDVIVRLVEEPPLPTWHYEMDTSQVRELLFFVDNEVVRGIAFHDEKGWVECDVPIGAADPCDGDAAIDFEGLEPYLEHIAAPEFRRVELVVRDGDEEVDPKYGVDENAPYVDIRVEEVQPNRVIQVNHVSLTLGELTPDNKNEMYIRAMEQLDVAVVDADWGRRVLDLFTDTSITQTP